MPTIEARDPGANIGKLDARAIQAELAAAIAKDATGEVTSREAVPLGDGRPSGVNDGWMGRGGNLEGSASELSTGDRERQLAQDLVRAMPDHPAFAAAREHLQAVADGGDERFPGDHDDGTIADGAGLIRPSGRTRTGNELGSEEGGTSATSKAEAEDSFARIEMGLLKHYDPRTSVAKAAPPAAFAEREGARSLGTEWAMQVGGGAQLAVERREACLKAGIPIG